MKTINSTTINKNGQTAKISNPKPSKELSEALQEGEQIIKNLKSGKRKGYRNMDDLIKSLDED